MMMWLLAGPSARVAIWGSAAYDPYGAELASLFESKAKRYTTHWPIIAWGNFLGTFEEVTGYRRQTWTYHWLVYGDFTELPEEEWISLGPGLLRVYREEMLREFRMAFREGEDKFVARFEETWGPL